MAAGTIRPPPRLAFRSRRPQATPRQQSSESRGFIHKVPEGVFFMRQRGSMKYRPDLERFEAKLLLSAGGSSRATPLAHTAAAAHAAAAASDVGTSSAHASPSAKQKGPGGGTAGAGYFAYRITNPTYRLVHLKPPFLNVAVQAVKPVPGKTYNILFVVVRNGTGQTFTASDGITVRVPGKSGTRQEATPSFPLLTGNETWAPNQWVVLYILGRHYYPLSAQVAAGFQIQAGGRSSTMVPGPSGIFLRLKYDPATFAKTLDSIVAYGQGAQMGNGSALGMPDTDLNVLVSAGSSRIDFAGHF